MEPKPASKTVTVLALAKRWSAPVLMLALLALGVQQGWFDYLTLEQVATHRDRLVEFVDQRYPLALAVFVAVYVAVVALSVPGAALLTMVGGFLFGWLVALFAVVIAATVGAALIFLIARTSLGATLAEKAGPWLDRLRDGFARDALPYLLFLRLVPAFPFWLVNLAPALLGMRLGPFVIGTFFGIIPGTAAFTFLGAGLDGLIAAQRATHEACLTREAGGGLESGEVCIFKLDPGSLLTTEIIIAFIGLGVVALIPVAARYIMARRRG